MIRVLLASGLPAAVAREWSLVLASTGIPHALEPGPTGDELWVDADDQRRAADEIGRYLRERTAPEGRVLVFGSFHTVAEALAPD
mgnify:CR=1 FL=1